MTKPRSAQAAMARKPALRARRGRSLPDDACPRCGTQMVERRGVQRLPINGEEIAVPGVAHLSCPKCHEVVLRFQDAKRLGEDAIAIDRKKHGLLSADEIRALRERFGLPRSISPACCDSAPTRVSRWEAGRNVQTGAMDRLLRLLRDLPGGIEYVRRHAA